MTSVSLRLTSLFGGVALLHLVGWGILLLLAAGWLVDPTWLPRTVGG